MGFDNGFTRTSDLPLPEPLMTHFNDASSNPDSKIYGANMGPTWGRQDRSGPHVGPMNFALNIVLKTIPVFTNSSNYVIWAVDFCRWRIHFSNERHRKKYMLGFTFTHNLTWLWCSLIYHFKLFDQALNDFPWKWTPFCKKNFQMHLKNRNCCILIRISPKCVP